MEKTNYNKITEALLTGLREHVEGNTVSPHELITVAEAILGIVKSVGEKAASDLATELGTGNARLEASHREMTVTATKLQALIEDVRASGAESDKQIRQQLLNEVKAIANRIPDDPDFTDVWTRINQVEDKIPTNLQWLDGEGIRNYLEALNGPDRLAMTAIDGLIEALQELKNAPRNAGGGFTPRGLQFLIDGIKKGLIANMNFVAGTGVSIAYSKVNGQDTITFNATGGGGSGVTVETPPESPNAVLTVFTVSAEPKWVVADGVTYYAGAGYTYAALQVTMEVAPSATVRAII